MKTLLTLTSLLMLSSVSISSFAGPYQLNNAVKSIHGPIAMSKEDAYQIGLSLINQYNDKSSKELSKKLSSRFDDVDSQSFMIKNAKVTVDEFLQGNGKIAYQPILSISYEFKKRELGN
ncbi:DUF3316 domain-containing protein (plasmid) [Vibrio alfacsensis]|uniref:DUF3316 domain-containing protein n=1 Tax=Vibrio alfacsensis TaxID=1074311 RepID=UPI002ADE699E|nr:DUF3316 domain-containing protein [Vibrio alfacsensis]WQE79469.1 DUF3316 domain-containing protein [Vibrio alfacsensis]